MDIFQTLNPLVCEILIQYLSPKDTIRLAHTCHYFYHLIRYFQRKDSCPTCWNKEQLCIKNECRLCRLQKCLCVANKTYYTKITQEGITYSNIKIECHTCTQCHLCHDEIDLSFCVSCHNKYCYRHNHMHNFPREYCKDKHRLHGSSKRIICKNCCVVHCPVADYIHCKKCHTDGCERIIQRREATGITQKCNNCNLFSDCSCPSCNTGFCSKHARICKTCDSFMCTVCKFVNGNTDTCWNCRQFNMEVRCSTCQHLMTQESKLRQCIQCQRIVCHKCKIHGCITCHRSICNTCKIGPYCNECRKK